MARGALFVLASRKQACSAHPLPEMTSNSAKGRCLPCPNSPRTPCPKTCPLSSSLPARPSSSWASRQPSRRASADLHGPPPASPPVRARHRALLAGARCVLPCPGPVSCRRRHEPDGCRPDPLPATCQSGWLREYWPLLALGRRRTHRPQRQAPGQDPHPAPRPWGLVPKAGAPSLGEGFDSLWHRAPAHRAPSLNHGEYQGEYQEIRWPRSRHARRGEGLGLLHHPEALHRRHLSPALLTPACSARPACNLARDRRMHERSASVMIGRKADAHLQARPSSEGKPRLWTRLPLQRDEPCTKAPDQPAKSCMSASSWHALFWLP